MTYKVTVTREGSNWLADVPEVPGAHTFARSLDGLAKSVREVIVLMSDLHDDADPDVHFVYDVDDRDLQHAVDVGRERDDIMAREVEIQAETLKSVHVLTARGYSMRDAARLLAITPGRVSQLANP